MSPDGLVAALVKVDKRCARLWVGWGIHETGTQIDTALARLAGAASGAAFVADFASELSPSAAAIALLEAAVCQQSLMESHARGLSRTVGSMLGERARVRWPARHASIRRNCGLGAVPVCDRLASAFVAFASTRIRRGAALLHIGRREEAVATLQVLLRRCFRRRQWFRA